MTSIIIFLWIAFAILSALVGSSKKMGAGGGFAVGILFGLIGFIIVLVSGDKEESKPKDISTNEVDELGKWYDLKEKGAISDEEFEFQKGKILGYSSDSE